MKRFVTRFCDPRKSSSLWHEDKERLPILRSLRPGCAKTLPTCPWWHLSYYVFVKKNGSRIHRSLDTKDRKVAERRLARFKDRIGELVNGHEANAGFGVLVGHWLEVQRHVLSAGTAKRKRQ